MSLALDDEGTVDVDDPDEAGTDVLRDRRSVGNDEETDTNTGILADGGAEGVDEGVVEGGMPVVMGLKDFS